MIGQDDLDYFEHKLERKILAKDQNPWFTINVEPAQDLIYLARLGRWAQTHGIPFIEDSQTWDVDTFVQRRTRAIKSLPTVKGST